MGYVPADVLCFAAGKDDIIANSITPEIAYLRAARREARAANGFADYSRGDTKLVHPL
jgi:hypothetical protein